MIFNSKNFFSGIPYAKSTRIRYFIALLPLLSFALAANAWGVDIHDSTPSPSVGSERLTRLSTAAQGGNDVSELVPGVPIEREIAAGKVHSFRIALGSSQFLRVTVAQKGIDVSVKVLDPGGKQIVEVNDEIALKGSEIIALVADTPGHYHLQVSGAVRAPQPGRYEIRAEHLRVASQQDRSFAAAEGAFAEARRLRRLNAEDSLRGAIIKYEEALQLYRATGERRREVNSLNALGDLYRLLGDNVRAANLFLEALAISRSINDQALQITTLIDLGGGIYFELGEPQKALAHLEEALTLSLKVDDLQAQAVVHSNIGAVYNLMDEPQEALEHFNRAMALHQASGNRRGKSMTLTNLGMTYSALGEYEKALTCYQEVLAIVRVANYPHGIASALENIGGIYISMGAPHNALVVLNEALILTQSSGNPRLEAITLGALGAAHYQLGELPKALEMYRRALKNFQEIGLRPEEAKALYHLGAVYASSGDKQKALEYFKQALPLSQSVKSRNTEALTLYGIAGIKSDLDRLDEARIDIEAALSIAESIRLKVTSYDLRAFYLASKRNIYEFYIDVLMRLHKRQPEKGFDRAALQASERARARSLLESLTEARANIRQGVDPTLLKRERSLQQRINAKADRLARLLSNKQTEGQAPGATQELDSLLTEYQHLQAQVRAGSPRYASLTQPQPLAVAEIQQQVLDRDSLLLEYSLGEKRSFLWAVTPTSITSYVLPKQEEIEQAARRVYELLTVRARYPAAETPAQRIERVNRADGEYAVAAASLSQMLLGPVAAQLGRKRLVIVSDGALQYVPFGALPAPTSLKSGVSLESAKGNRSRPHSQGSGLQTRDPRLPLIIDHEIVNLPSASVLALMRGELAGRLPAPRAVAVLADPVFSGDDPRLKLAQNKAGNGALVRTSTSADGEVSTFEAKRSARESGVAQFERLRFSRQEADAITALAPAEKTLIAVDFAANRATVTDPELARYRVLHLATHGLLNSQHPELSGIVLSLVDETGRPQDGFLRLHEIYNLKLGADLVVLSACQTALGREIKGEGLLGLTRGFMYAGAPRVVASLWNVDDRATAELMKRFYAGLLKERQKPAAALRTAQASMLKEQRWQSPHFWAAFVMQGEWR